MKLKDFKKLLWKSGFKYLRHGKGSHEIWVNSRGETFSFPAACTEVYNGIVWQFKRKHCKYNRTPNQSDINSISL